MAQFRKKPVVIEAHQFTPGHSLNEFPEWLMDAFQHSVVLYHSKPEPHLVIGTLEGDMRAEAGDWVICGVKGELYPCKPDIFAATYEAV